VWSAACSSGEEVYSLAMLLDDELGDAWDILGSDISTRMLKRAQSGHYPLERTQHIPPAYLKRYCLRGFGAHEGTLLVDRKLRARVRFAHINLNETLPLIGTFDVVLLRNVMIYFNAETKREVVARVLGQLVPGGTLFIGHSESLNDISDAVQAVAPSVYRKR
jgi:chemotaxis protein methyltransferase CheR